MLFMDFIEGGHDECKDECYQKSRTGTRKIRIPSHARNPNCLNCTLVNDGRPCSCNNE